MLSRALEKSGYFFVLSDIHRPVGGLESGNKIKDETDVESYEPGLPVVSFRFSDVFQKEYPDVQQKWVQVSLRTSLWRYCLTTGLILDVTAQQRMDSSQL